MKLTKEQRAYVDNRLEHIYREKTKNFQSVYFGHILQNDNYPPNVNKAIDLLNTYQDTHNKKVKEQALPFSVKLEKIREKLLFTSQLEEVQALLDSFSNYTG